MRNRIIKAIKEHPEGLTISGVAEEAGCTRLTVRRYLQDILKEGIAKQRNVGIAKLIIPISDKDAKRNKDNKI